MIIQFSKESCNISLWQIRNTFFYSFMLVGLFLPSVSFGQDFEGALKEVTITDSAGTNTPPTAVINFTQNGDTVDFDASGSTDSDGSIAEYRWDFGGGVTAVGSTASHTFADPGEYPVTLSVVDNSGGMALSQASISTIVPLAGYRLNVAMQSSDNDDLGVMFNYQDNDNYYRFSWNQQNMYRRLVKRVNGQFILLVEDNVPYQSGTTYQVEIEVNNAVIGVRINNNEIFLVEDGTISGQGSIALYSRANVGSRFDDLIINNLSGTELFSDDFSSGSLIGWTVVDESNESGPPNWVIESGVLVQSTNALFQQGDEIDKLGTYILHSLE